MLAERYVTALQTVLKQVETTQMDAISQAADWIAETVEKGGNVHVFDTGHIINSELIDRAGGLALLKALKYTFSVENPVREIERQGIVPSLEGIGKIVLCQSKAAPGDVLILGSVSGKTVNVIELALAAKEMGLKLVAVTSLAYSSALQSDHSSGKRLFEVADLVIDNCAPRGDAMVEVEGVENKFGPVSGLSAAFALWCLSAEIVEKLLAKGISPTLFRSINAPDGRENYNRMCERYAEKGY